MRSSFPGQDLVDQQGQRAGGGDGRVKLAERAGGGVARVEVGFFAGLGQLLVQLFEFLDRDEDFAANDEVGRNPHPCPTTLTLRKRGQAGTRPGGRGVDATGIFSGIVFTVLKLAVMSSPISPSPRGALHEEAIPIMKDDTQAVDLGLDNELGVLHAVIQLANTLVPGTRIPGSECICQAEDGAGGAPSQICLKGRLRHAGWVNRALPSPGGRFRSGAVRPPVCQIPGRL